MGRNRGKRLPAFLLAVCLLLPFLPRGSHGAFSDVQDQWFAPAVEEMAQRGLIGGFPDGTFRPGDWVKRGGRRQNDCPGRGPAALYPAPDGKR